MMKGLKVAAAALTVSILMTAFATSASASAKVCSTAGAGPACKAGHGKVYNGKLVGKLTGNFVLTSTSSTGEKLATITCASSELEGEITNGEIGTGKITKLLWSTCSTPSCFGATTFSASVSAANPWAATATTTTPGVETNGILDVTGVTDAFICSSPLFTCKYKAAVSQFHITSSDASPTMSMNVVTEREEGPEAPCGVKADQSATYNITTPTSLFIE
jgi:hypothetical protein